MQPDKLRELYADLSEAELAEAAENLDRYIALAWKIYENLQGHTNDL